MKFRFALLVVVCVGLKVSQGAEVRDLLQRGDALDRELKTQEALKVYLEADQADPHNAEVLYRIAKEYGLSMSEVSAPADKKERGEKALDFAKQAVAAGPNNAQAHLALAISYGRLARLSDNKTKIAYSKLVKEQADRALQLDPNDDLVYHVLGAWNYELANLNPILRTIASALYGKLPEASNEAAVKYLKKAVSLNPNRIGHHVELGRAYAAMGNKAQARAELETALRMPEREKGDKDDKIRARAALADL